MSQQKTRTTASLVLLKMTKPCCPQPPLPLFALVLCVVVSCAASMPTAFDVSAGPRALSCGNRASFHVAHIVWGVGSRCAASPLPVLCPAANARRGAGRMWGQAHAGYCAVDVGGEKLHESCGCARCCTSCCYGWLFSCAPFRKEMITLQVISRSLARPTNLLLPHHYCVMTGHGSCPCCSITQINW